MSHQKIFIECKGKRKYRRRNKKGTRHRKQKANSRHRSNYLILNVNRLSHPMKSQRLSDLVKKKNLYIYISPTICCLQDSCFWFKDTNRLKVKGQKKTYRANSNYKRARVVATLISDKMTKQTLKMLQEINRNALYNDKSVNPSGRHSFIYI